MPISDVIQSVFASTFINHVMASTPFVSVVEDRSSDILAGGDGLIVPKSSGLVSVSDYTDDDDVVYSTLSPEKIEFSLDKKKYIAFQFEYEDAAQVSADVWSQAVSESAQTFASQVSVDFRSLYSGEPWTTRICTRSLSTVTGALPQPIEKNWFSTSTIWSLSCVRTATK